MSKIPVTEVCLIHLKGPYNLKDPSTPEGAIWASSISTLRKCPGFRDIYTGSIVEDRTKARMFLSESPFCAVFVFAQGKVSEEMAFDMGERSQYSHRNRIREQIPEPYVALF